MRGGKREEDEAGGEPQPLQEIAACQNVHAALPVRLILVWIIGNAGRR